MQFYLISPLIVWPMWKFKRYGVAFGAAVLFVACLIPGVFTYVNQWPPEITITVMY
jgi:peptidoglycan/LPS O-acetylase OafA/YrhL